MPSIKLFLVEMGVFVVKETKITIKEETQCGTGGLVAIATPAVLVLEGLEKMSNKHIDLKVSIIMQDHMIMVKKYLKMEIQN